MKNIDKVKGLEPESFFRFFAQISDIPRCSGNEEEICKYILNFAEKNGLKSAQDKAGNVVVYKGASKGYEKLGAVIIQSHVDMVGAKALDKIHDFEKDPISLIVDRENDTVKADGTTLGADNGVAVAMTLAILEDKSLVHPKLEALFTVDEETGMSGVQGLDTSLLNGKTLINIDSEEEGTILAGCAGGVRALVTLPILGKDVDEDVIHYNISISGLIGGHSGAEIHNNRVNAIVVLGNILSYLEGELSESFNILRVSGGEKMNAIPRFSQADIVITPDAEERFLKAFGTVAGDYTEEIIVTERDVKIQVIKREPPDDIEPVKCLSSEDKERLSGLLTMLPNGVRTMSTDIEGLVESSNNIGVLETFEERIEINSAIRSNKQAEKKEIVEDFKRLCSLFHGELELKNDYPEWSYSPSSPIRSLMIDTWKEMFGEDLLVTMIHAGLECGFFKEKLGDDVDMVSLGPDIRGAHTPEESFSISSTEKVYGFILKCLENMKGYKIK